jgi:hypothetical protein
MPSGFPIAIHIFLSKGFFGPGQQSADRGWVEVKLGSEFSICEPFPAQQNQADLILFESAERLPQTRPFFDSFQFLLWACSKPEIRAETFIASPPPLLLDLVKREPEPGSIEPAFDICGDSRRLKVQAPERLRSHLLSASKIASYPVEKSG